MEIVFKTKNEKQLQAVSYWLDQDTEQILYGGAKGGGKSFLGCSLIFGDALIYPETHYFIARQELTDLRKYTIPSIYEVFQKWGLDTAKYFTFDGQYNVFNLYNGSKVYLIACKELPSDPLYERFGSMQMTRGWIEEAGEVAEAAKANLWLSIGRWKNDEFKLKKKLLMTANPKKGWLKRDFVDPWKQNLLAPKLQFIQAFATDNVYLPQDYVETLRNEKDTVRRQRLWEGDWDYDEDKDALVSFDAISDTFSNSVVKDNQRYITADIARLGRDRTVIGIWDGLELFKIEVRQQQDTDKTKGQIRELAVHYKVPYSHILVDEDGIGGAIVDGLMGIKGFVANSRPFQTAHQVRLKQNKTNSPFIPISNFRNLKSQCGFKMAELINERKIAFATPDDKNVITEELMAILRQKNQDGDGKLELRSKEDVKIELGRSPDIADMIMMRAWFELKKESGDDQETHIIKMRQDESFMINRGFQKTNSAE